MIFELRFNLKNMNTADLQNYLPTALLLIGAIGTSAAIREYGDKALKLLSSMTQTEKPINRIEVDYDESRTVSSPMILSV